MAIRVEHGKPSTIIAAAQRAGEARAAVTVAQQAQEESDRLEAQQQEFEFKKVLRQQDMAIDLQMQERAKLWEIEKMQLRSQGDFAREERKRAQALDSYDAAVKYIDDSEYFDEGQKEGLKFKAKMKLLNVGVTDRSIFPEMYERQGAAAERPPSPTQRMSAMKMLEDERFEEPTGWRKYAPGWLGGREPVSESDALQKQILEGIVAGKPNVPTGTISADIPLAENIPSTAAEFENVVAQLKRTDINAAKEYYDKWARKF